MGLPILYSFRRCPYAIRARMSIVRTQFQVELREVILRDRPEPVSYTHLTLPTIYSV